MGLDSSLLARDFDRTRQPAQLIDQATSLRRLPAPNAPACDFLGMRNVKLAALGYLRGEIPVEFSDHGVELRQFIVSQRPRQRKRVADCVGFDRLHSDAEVIEQ